MTTLALPHEWGWRLSIPYPCIIPKLCSVVQVKALPDAHGEENRVLQPIVRHAILRNRRPYMLASITPHPLCAIQDRIHGPFVEFRMFPSLNAFFDCVQARDQVGGIDDPAATTVKLITHEIRHVDEAILIFPCVAQIHGLESQPISEQGENPVDKYVGFDFI
jgi:hypothetical protein